MNRILDFLFRHGYWVVFGSVSIEQAGFPIPAVPVLLGMGALTADGRYSFGLALLVATVAALPGDLLWYELGRRLGYGVLRVICRISLEAEVCVRRTELVFVRYGSPALVFAKFIPGFSTVAPPLAGMLKMPRWRFLLLDAAGAAIWAGAYLFLGYLFRRQLEAVAQFLSSLGSWLIVALAAPLAAWILRKWLQHRRFVRQITSARLPPEEVMRRLESGEPPLILDLRYGREYREVGRKLPGAIHIPAEQLHRRHNEIPRGRDIILYCS